MEAAGARVKLIRMDGMNLTFPDTSFDFVISANVIEHVPDPTKFIREAARVLKPNGVCYLETAPVWSGPRGHHVMESMIAENCPLETNFRDDGSVIPHWSHLTLDWNQLAELLRQKLRPATCDYIIQLVYDSDILNRVSCKQTVIRWRMRFHLYLSPHGTNITRVKRTVRKTI